MRELKERKRRLSRAYADGAFGDDEYESKLGEIEANLRLTEGVALPGLEEAAQLFASVPQLWKEATPEERRKLLGPLIETVYLDLECRRVGGIVPASGVRQLLEGAMLRATSPATFLLSDDDAERLKV